MKSPQRNYVLLVLLAGASLSLPALLLGFPPAADDSVSHAVWFAHFSKQFWAGDLYPRWLSDMNAGLGSPVFFYYAPLPYHAASLLAPLFPANVSTLRPLGVAAALALTASGLTAYAWLRKISDPRSAVAGAIIYMVAPYHLAFDLYMRDALAEVFAFVWLPLILNFVRGARDGRKYSPVWLASSYALLILTHLPTTLIFSVVPVCYAYFTTPRERRMRALLITIGAMMLGAGLAAVYLLPAMTMQGYVSMRDLESHLYYEKWVPSVTANVWRHQGKIIWSVLTTAGLVACAHFAARAWSKGEDKSERKFWLVVAVLSIFMMTFLSDPIWRVLPILQQVQFPWRFNVILCVAASAVVTLGLHSVRQSGARVSRLAVGCACVIFVGWIGLTSLSLWQAYGDREIARAFEKGVGVWVALGKDAPEYRPALAPSNTPEYLEGLKRRFCLDGEKLAQACVVEGVGAVAVERWQPRRISLRVSSASGATLNVRQFYFPGWAATLDGRAHPLTPSASDALLSLSVPGGEHRVEISLRRQAPELAGQIVSAISVVLLLLFVSLRLRAKGSVG
jgi:hypothetical protein